MTSPAPVDSPADTPAGLRARRLSAAAVSAPFVAVLVTILARVATGDDPSALAMAAHANLALVGIGFVLGIAGLFTAIVARVARAAFRSMAAIVFNGFALIWALEAFRAA